MRMWRYANLQWGFLLSVDAFKFYLLSGFYFEFFFLSLAQEDHVDSGEKKVYFIEVKGKFIST